MPGATYPHVECGTCEGQGYIMDDDHPDGETCGTCGGTGQVRA
jgi:DnaJ-class molecular chaperone